VLEPAARLVQAGLRVPAVEVDAQPFDGLPDAGQYLRQPDLAQLGDGFLLRHIQEAIAVFGHDLARQVDDVCALVVLLVQRRVEAERLLVTQKYGFREGTHLRARVIDVILALHLPARSRQQVAEAVAQHGIAGGPHVELAGGVRADELHLARLAAAQVDVAILPAAGFDFGHLAGQPGIAQPEIDEARREHLRLPERGMCRQVRRNGLGNRQGRHARRLSELHGDAGGIVTVLQVFGTPDLDGGDFEGGQAAALLCSRDALSHNFRDVVANHNGSCSYQLGPASRSTLSAARSSYAPSIVSSTSRATVASSSRGTSSTSSSCTWSVSRAR